MRWIRRLVCLDFILRPWGRMRAGSLAILGIPLLIWQGCQGQPPAQEALVRAWGDTLISKREFNAMLSEHAPECKGGSSEPHCEGIKRHLLSRAIEEAILIRKAEQSGIVISREEMEAAERQMLVDYQGSQQEVRKGKQKSPRGREVMRDRLMIQRFMDLLLSGVDVGDQEVLARFKERRELFVRPREVRVRQILVGTWEEAADLQRRIKKGEEFSRLARGHSLGPEASSGGDLGYVRPGQVPPEIEEVVFTLDQGEVSEIVPSVYGFHILKVEDTKGPEELMFSEVQGEIRERLLAEKATNAFEAWMGDEWRGAQIEVLDPSLAPVMERRGVGS